MKRPAADHHEAALHLHCYSIRYHQEGHLIALILA